MHHRIVSILRRFQQDPSPLLGRPALLAICKDVGHQWRECFFDPVTTIHVFLVQILHGNTAIRHLPHLTGRQFSDAAYCLARSRLPLEVFHRLVRRVADSLHSATRDAGRWLGHRVFVVDGSAFSMPDTPELQAHFGQTTVQRPGCGFPIAHILALFHVGTGMLLEVLTGPLYTHDMADVTRLHPRLGIGDVLLGDRGFCSFAHLALLVERGAHGVFRMHQRQVVDFTPHRAHRRPGSKKGPKGSPSSRWVRYLGVKDQLVAWLKPKRCPEWMTADQYASLPGESLVRELRYSIGGSGFRVREVTLVTTLLDAEGYPLEELAGLYRGRWQVESNLKNLKTTMKMDVLRCETVAGVSKELAMFALTYNLVRLVMLESSRRQGVPVDRISFIDALRWLAEARPGATLRKLVVNRERAGRAEPRVRKRRPKSYPLMTRPRGELREDLLKRKEAA
jgi:Transposase DDE domain